MQLLDKSLRPSKPDKIRHFNKRLLKKKFSTQKVMKIHCESSGNVTAPPASNMRAVEMTVGGKNTSGILETRSSSMSVHTKRH